MNKVHEQNIIHCQFKNDNSLCTSHIRLFKALPKNIQEDLVRQAEHVQYPKGTIIAEEGDHVDAILIIRSGRIKTCTFDANGEEYIMDILHEGQAIWHDMFLKNYTYHYNIVSLSQVLLCKINRTDFMHLLSKYPNAAMSLIAMLSTELQEAKAKSALLSIRQPITRVAGFLLNKDQTCQNHEIQMKLEDISASIGLRAETVSRCITKLEDQHMIQRIGQGRLKVINRKALHEFFISGQKL